MFKTPPGLTLLYLLLLLPHTVVAAGSGPDPAALARELVRSRAGLVDSAGVLTPAGSRALRLRLEKGLPEGGRIWILTLPAGQDPAPTLVSLAGRLAPGDHDLLVVWSSRGMKAVAGSIPRPWIDRAFERHRRALATDPARGLTAFVEDVATRLERRKSHRGIAVGILALAIVGLGLYGIGRYRQLKVKLERWSHEDQRTHRRRTAACREALLAYTRDHPGSDETFVTFKERLDALASRTDAGALDDLEDLSVEILSTLGPREGTPE